MHRFWDTLVEPLLAILQPETLVEIGSGQGKNTSNLLEFCQRQSATLYVIDPEPQCDIVAWQERYGLRLVFHRSLSLSAIPKIARFDVVLINGDHNWYTVFHELKLIEKRCRELSQPFPLVLLHDIGWPYGRRDAYAAPERIPAVYCKPYAQKGLRLGTQELYEEGGLHPHRYHSIYEHDQQNGVLTAVEDFMREAEATLELVRMSGFSGLGLLVPVSLKEQNEKLSKLLKTLESPPQVERYIERIEADRIEWEIRCLDGAASLEKLEALWKEEEQRWQKEVKQIQRRLMTNEQLRAEQVAAATRLQQQMAEQGERLSDTQAEVSRKEAQVATLQQQMAEQGERLSDTQAEVSRKEAQVATLQQQMAEQAAAATPLQNQLAETTQILSAVQEKMRGAEAELIAVNAARQEEQQEREGEVNRLRQQIVNAERMLAEQHQQQSALNSRLRQDLTRLIGWLEQLHFGISALLTTRRWKIGNTLGEILRRCLLQPREPMATDYLHETVERFQAWKASYEKDVRNPIDSTGNIAFPTAPLPVQSDDKSRVRKPVTANDKKNEASHLPHPILDFLQRQIPLSGKKNRQLVKQCNENLTDLLSTRDKVEHFCVSVIMPTYNRGAIITAAINSVIAQSYRNWELHICDDGSEDDTEKRIEPYVTDPRIHYHKLAHRGAPAARNHGLAHATGDLIAYLDSDNIWHKDFLAAMTASLSTHQSFCAYAGYFDIQIKNAKPTLKSLMLPEFDYEALSRKNFIDLNVFVHSRILWERLGGFDERLTRQQDWDLALRYTFHHRPLLVKAFLCYYLRDQSLNQLTYTHKGDSNESFIKQKLASVYSGQAAIRCVGTTQSPNTDLPDTVTPTITVLVWDVCRNHFSKAYNVAEVLSRHYKVQLVGFQFFGDIFEPYRDETPPFEVQYFRGTSFPHFFHDIAKALRCIKGDVLYVVKPRLPSLGLALLYQYHFRKPIILEINDLESVVSRPDAPRPEPAASVFSRHDLAEVWEQLEVPYSDTWSLLMEELAPSVQRMVTHNRNIDAAFGQRATFIRNIKDEAYFTPELYARDAVRLELGLGGQDRVILFSGMLRKHKGIYEMLELLDFLDDPRYKVVFIGSRETPDQKNLMQKQGQKYADSIKVLPPQNRNAVARYTAAADIVLIWLDPQVQASHFQMPYKLTDALAMQVPVIANPLSDLTALGEAGCIKLVEFRDFAGLKKELEQLFNEPEQMREMLERGRRLYIREFSYAAAEEILGATIAAVQREGEPDCAATIKFAEWFGEFYQFARLRSHALAH